MTEQLVKITTWANAALRSRDDETSDVAAETILQLANRILELENYLRLFKDTPNCARSTLSFVLEKPIDVDDTEYDLTPSPTMRIIRMALDALAGDPKAEEALRKLGLTGGGGKTCFSAGTSGSDSAQNPVAAGPRLPDRLQSEKDPIILNLPLLDKAQVLGLPYPKEDGGTQFFRPTWWAEVEGGREIRILGYKDATEEQQTWVNLLVCHFPKKVAYLAS